VSEYSFPSGHAANTAALVGALVLILRRRLWMIAGAAVLIVVGLSQLVLGRHYPSDVLAGWAWALTWVYVLRRLFRNVTKGGPG
jgi:undecaprenyl-diphosphatase